MAKYAEKTQVSVARSKAEIEDCLLRYGATQFVTGWNDTGAAVGFKMKDKSIKFLLPLPVKESMRNFKDRYGWNKVRSDEDLNKVYEQACRTKWRALLLCIKAKLEAVESGITTFEHEFLAHFMTANGMTVGDVLIPQLDAAVAGGNIGQLLLG